MDKRFIGALIAIILILGGIAIFSSGNKNNSSSSGSSSKPTSHVEGLGQDKVTLVEYGDYQCPFCGQYFPVVKQFQQEYNNEIFFQFRNLPLTQLHANAFAGARAAEAAGLMGQFWQMHDLLYENQNSWAGSSDPESQFVGYAQQLGLDATKFKENFAGSQVNNSINADVAQFPKDYTSAIGSYDPNKDEGTPTFFLDNKLISPGVFNADETINAPASLANFIKDVNAEIKKKGFTPPASSGSSTPATSSTSPTQSVQ